VTANPSIVAYTKCRFRLVIMVYGLDLSGPKYLQFRELSMPIYIEADDLGAPIVTMPGY
jgi:hypothetical protein